jgi:murein DD-endopeptidase MepM/ murein hydrolase activator NlpD
MNGRAGVGAESAPEVQLMAEVLLMPGDWEIGGMFSAGPRGWAAQPVSQLVSRPVSRNRQQLRMPTIDSTDGQIGPAAGVDGLATNHNASCLSFTKNPPIFIAMARRSVLTISSLVALACAAAAPALASSDGTSTSPVAPTESTVTNTTATTSAPTATTSAAPATTLATPAGSETPTSGPATSVSASSTSSNTSSTTGSTTSVATGPTTTVDPLAPTTTTPATPTSAAGATTATTVPKTTATTTSSTTDSTAAITPIDPTKGAPRSSATPAGGWPIRPIVFPAAGPVSYWDGWGDFRGDIPGNFHIGVDIMGSKLQPLVAATNGTITHIVQNHVTAGWGLVIKDDEGWDYRYYHMNNDTPGTDDKSNPLGWRFAPGVEEGSRVVAGQLIGYMGDSGDSEDATHVHFEIHRPGAGAEAVNPFPSVRASQKSTRCNPPAGLAELPNFIPPTDTDAEVVSVPAFAGFGAFQLSANGTVFRVGSARDIGMASFNVADGPCVSDLGPGSALR